MPIGVLRTRAVDMVGDARSQDALLVLLLVLFYPEWLLPGWPDKSHCMVTSVLSNSLTKALPRSRHTGDTGMLGHRPAGTRGLFAHSRSQSPATQAADSGTRARQLQTLAPYSSVW